MSDVTPPQAGWYADPENPAGERWWNGSGWSDHKRDATTAAVPPAVEYVPPAVAADSGFTFGNPAVPGRPDPYAPPPAAAAAPYYAAAPYAAAPYAASPYAPAPYGAPAPSRSNGLAIAGLAVSIAGLLVGVLAAIAGIILSAFGLSRARQAEAAGLPNSGRGLAMAGLIVGIAVLVLNILFIVFYFAVSMSSIGTTY